MAQRKKTPKHLVKLIEDFDGYLVYAEERMRVKLNVPEEHHAEHIKCITVDGIVNQVWGAIAMLESALTAYGCYAGFTYRSTYLTRADGTKYREFLRLDSADFAEWRRSYNVRS